MSKTQLFPNLIPYIIGSYCMLHIQAENIQRCAFGVYEYMSAYARKLNLLWGCSDLRKVGLPTTASKGEGIVVT